MNFADAMSNESNWTRTENGAAAHSTTGSKLVDLFGVIGSLRTRTDSEIESMYRAAYNENRELAIKMAFYCRNVRGGLGERRTARVIFKWLANNHPNVVINNMDNFAFYGRWDDLYTFHGTPAEKAMWNMIRLQWIEDCGNYKAHKPISIMAKWLASVNTSSEKTCALGRKTARALDLTEKEYRKALSKFRAYLNVCERNMSKQDWEKIVYPEVPSYAMKKYKKSFVKHDGTRFEAYRRSLEQKMANGTITAKDIKSGTMYPMDLAKEYMNSARGASYSYWSANRYGDGRLGDYNSIIEAQWKTLPNYIEGENDVIVMADVSGSMTCPNNEPMAASTSLAIYMAEHNKGAYANHYMTFTDQPHFIKINPNDSLHDKLTQVLKAGVGYNTNLERAFTEVLNVARKNCVKPEDMPKAIVVISDGEIDHFCRGYGMDFYDVMKKKYASYGYTIPYIIFWNVAARQNAYHTTATKNGTMIVSGFSASSFRDVLACIGFNAYDAMVKTLSNPMYDRVRV